jgi:ATP-dependent DNA ligase
MPASGLAARRNLRTSWTGGSNPACSSGESANFRSLCGRGREFHQQACAMSLEGIVSKRADAPYTSGNRGLWRKALAADLFG